MSDVRSRDVARAAGARSLGGHSGLHGFQHDRVLAHAEIIVAAPYSYVTGRLPGAVQASLGESTHDTFQLGEVAVASLFTQRVEPADEEALIVDADTRNQAGPVKEARLPSLHGAMIP